MPYPTHPEKHRWEPLVTPEQSRDYAGSETTEVPDRVILGFGETLYDHLTDQYPGRAVDGTFGDCYLFETDSDREGTSRTADAPTVGVCGRFGIGAPTTAMVLEELIAGGTEAFCAVGYAGCLDPAIPVGETVVPDRAIRDEGTSHHYVEPGEEIEPTPRLTASLRDGIAAETVHTGPTWTTDATYRETREEVVRFRDRGVLTVEMEAAAVFAVARHHDVSASAVFTVSDHLTPDDWEPSFRDAERALCRSGERVKRLLETSA